MLARSVRTLFALALAVCCFGCPPAEPTPDAGEPEIDAGPLPVACDSPEDCASIGGVCRQLLCALDVPCSDDLECGLGERCISRQCRFTGCTANEQCATGYCDVATYSCAECGASTDCPPERPVCDRGLRQCTQCTNDSECAPPGPSHCSTEGRCVGCLTDSHCPNGLQCSSGNFCVGAPLNAPCPTGTSCGEGLVCVNLNNNPVCLQACPLFAPNCATGQICFSLSYSATTSLVFESQGPIGVCFAPQSGLRGVREPCARSSTGSNCQPNLVCVPDSASLSLCRPFCNPFASGTCPAGEKCTSFVGDFNGREYGLCMPDTGFGTKCTNDRVCRGSLTCQPWEDPSESLYEVSGICQFSAGDGGAMAPCREVRLGDGGVIPAARQCRSAQCVTDPVARFPATAPYYCFGACSSDTDCGDAGVCDADFNVTTAAGTTGVMRGCRPRCQSELDCAGYDAGVTCLARVTATPSFTTTCSPSPGSLLAGAPCVSSTQCRSQLCVLDDSRGVTRTGVCASPCRDGETCPSTSLPLACQPTTHLVSRGTDGVAGTADDRLVTPRLCAGATCASDDDCRPDGGTAVCALELDPTTPQSALVKRCMPPTSFSRRGGDACAIDAECASGTCGTLQAPSMGAGRVCFEACTASTVCPGATTCRLGGLSVATVQGAVSVDSCAP